MDEAWAAVERAGDGDARRSCSPPSPTGSSRLVVEEAGIRFDFAKTHLEPRR